MRDVQEVMAEVGAKSTAAEHPSGTHLEDSSWLKIYFCSGASLSCFAFKHKHSVGVRFMAMNSQGCEF